MIALALRRWSVEHVADFWQAMWDHFDLHSPTPHGAVLAGTMLTVAVSLSDRWTRQLIDQVATLLAVALTSVMYVGIGVVCARRFATVNGYLIGAGALIPEGREIPDNSLVMGAPGKVVREVSEGQIQMLTGSALHYVENWKRYAKGLKRID